MSELLKECVWANYYRLNRDIDNGRYKYERKDLVVAKEKTTKPDGTIEKQLKFFVDYPRPFWITKSVHQKYKDKREWIELDKVNEHRCPHHSLSYHVQKKLGVFNIDSKLPIRVVNRSPYVFGTDYDSAYYVKELYNHKYKGHKAGLADVVMLDIETDVLGTNDKKIILITITKDGLSHTHALREFITRTTLNYENEWNDILDKDFSDIRDKYDIKLFVHDNEVDMLRTVFDTLHNEWKPDIVSGWNVMMFDFKTIYDRLIELDQDPIDYFVDKHCPREFQQCWFKEGRGFAVSDSGKKTNLRPIARWHEVVAPANWVWIDAMSLYYQLRKHKGIETTYRLDAILNKHLKRGKYEIEEAEKYRGLDKHVFMQRHRPIHYAVYNAFDCIGLNELDKRNNDLRSGFFSALGLGAIRDFQSNPTKLSKDFASYLLRKRGKVIGSTSDGMFNEDDKRLPPISDWIVALPTTLLKPSSGLSVLEEYPDIRSNFFTHNGDNDIESSYPWGGILTNLSKMTTEIEVCDINGVSMRDRYTIGLNLMSGRVNAASVARLAYGIPHQKEMLDIMDHTWQEFMEHKNKPT